MRFGIRSVAPIVLAMCAGLFAAVPCILPSGIERLPNGNTLITESGSMSQPNARVIEIDSLEHLVWAYIRSDIKWAHTARRTADGTTVITATDSNRVLEVNARGDVVWEMRSGLDYPNEAYRLDNGHTLITDRDNNRVIEVDTNRTIVWSYTNLNGPHNGRRLANGHTTVSNSNANKVIEVDSAGQIVWQYGTGLSWPRCCERLSNGNTLIASSSNSRVIEVDSAGTVVWSITSGVSMPYQATRLANGNTMISTGSRVIEVDPAKTIVWQYPPVMAAAVAVETLSVTNPTSNCSLYVHIHRPTSAGPSAQVPAVVLVPDLSNAGTVFDADTLADDIASEGFAVLHFDADGRGQSTGTEDYDGPTQQDGLAACAELLASRPYVDSENLGIYSRGYGIVMATGMIARHATPHIKFLMDWEGPSDRYQTSSDSGGHVPVPVDSESFWLEREAGRFIKNVPGAYLRIQTVNDHTDRIPDNHHAIALIDSATSTTHGGAGIAAWTRVNDSVMNTYDSTYTVSAPPAWIREQEERHQICREILYLRELAEGDFTGVASSSPVVTRTSFVSVSPNPCHGSAVLRWNAGPLDRSSRLRVFDASGRLVSSFIVNGSSFVLPAPVAAGIYYLRLDTGSRSATARMVVD